MATPSTRWVNRKIEDVRRRMDTVEATKPGATGASRRPRPPRWPASERRRQGSGECCPKNRPMTCRSRAPRPGALAVLCQPFQQLRAGQVHGASRPICQQSGNAWLLGRKTPTAGHGTLNIWAPYAKPAAWACARIRASLNELAKAAASLNWSPVTASFTAPRLPT